MLSRVTAATLVRWPPVHMQKVSHGHTKLQFYLRSKVSLEHTVYPKKYAHGFCFAVLCCGYTLIIPYPSGLLHWNCGNLTIAPVPSKQPWWIWINTSCEFIMNDCITTTKQSTTKPCAYFLRYTVADGHKHSQQSKWVSNAVMEDLSVP